MHHAFSKIATSFIAAERNFFPTHLSRQLKHLYLSNAIFTFASSAGALFESLYLYSIGYSLAQIMSVCFFVYALYFCIMPLGGKLVKRYGFEHGMMYGSVCLIFFYLSLLFIQAYPYAIIAAVVFLALQKMCFWPGYHADFALFGENGERGRELSNIVVLASIMAVVGPLAAGAVIATLGFPAYFAMLCIVMILSNVPFLFAKEQFVPSSFSYGSAYANLFKKEHRKYLVGYLGFGEEIIIATVWPVLLYLTFSSFSATGFAIAVSTAITAFVLLYVGRETDLTDRTSVLRIGAVFSTFSWILRLAARSGASIILVDFATRTSKGMLSLPLFSGLYEYANKTSVVQSVIFFEMSVALGKMLVSLILAVIFVLLPDGWFYAFAVGALFSLLYFSLTIKYRPGYAPLTAKA